MDLVIRAAVIWLFVYLVTRAVGKRELNSLEPFDLIMLVVLGDLIQQGVTQDDYSVTGALLVVSTVVLLTVFASYLNWRVPGLRRYLEGEPIVVVKDGEPIERNMKRERLTVEEIAEEARGQQIASLSDIKWAVLENSGKISFITR
jgi:uncharacterized membrane protein YcaP (DUF421 family)